MTNHIADFLDPALEVPAKRALIIRVALVMLGTVLVLVGLAGLVLPVMPGWLFIIPGLALLAGEFVWARSLLDHAKHAHTKAMTKLRSRV